MKRIITTMILLIILSLGYYCRVLWCMELSRFQQLDPKRVK